VKDVNSVDSDIEFQNEEEELFKLDNYLNSKLVEELESYSQLTESQLKYIIDFLIYLSDKYKLLELPTNKLENSYINNELEKKNNWHKKHLKQISSIVGHLDKLLNEETTTNNVSYDEKCLPKSICLIELGAGRGKLSYWCEQSILNDLRVDPSLVGQKNFNICLIERGAQRHKFDLMMKKDMEETNSKFERVRIDLKDLVINELPLVKSSNEFILFGKHVCGVGTDYSLRCLKSSLNALTKDYIEKKIDSIKFKGLLLAVCCHHVCEWKSFCGQNFLKKLGIYEKLFYIIRSISSWCTCGERDNLVASTNDEGLFF
jgi:tRNA:m4X modification enzyme